MDIFANIDDSCDLFETKIKKKADESAIKQSIFSYKPKIAYPKVCEKFLF